ncbi:ABC transporter ATP-binding protein [Ammonifex thiophilus]|uniref:ABC transporter ATP-binding protein n=1 Tax=Ammonifex thiophilus TaxID=444093 RepID=A0A3D8P4Z2_9THEO|nr:ABC transporter ATP-binding protein [Ammonifex thiophilus]RDV82876.1 ABC transporter ATP-binding protein [Ammonifex thiophilus]
MLELNNVEVIYDRVVLVLKGLSLKVPPHSIVALLGANGAGKTTTLKAISGLLQVERGKVTDGQVIFQGEDITNWDPEKVSRKGIFHVLEGRHVFEHLTVEENLLAATCLRRDRQGIKEDLEKVYSYFPRLKELRRKIAGYLSGGEQQMLAIGRALMSRPHLVLLDEPSLGLSPLLVSEIFHIVKEINRRERTTILVVEQNARVALSVADYAYVMENGRIVLEGEPEKLRENEDVREFYLGLTPEGRKSYREVKHYKRRKRWLS